MLFWSVANRLNTGVTESRGQFSGHDLGSSKGGTEILWLFGLDASEVPTRAGSVALAHAKA
jgi:hypothetical protein